MIIKKLNLISFGKFINKEIELEDGINLIEGKNEAGKSTITAFIRFMLYGMPSTKISKINPITEKEKYFPWGSDVVIGTMEVMFNGKNLIIEREYRKNTNKKPIVRNIATGETIEEFSGSEPGEMFFEVKADTFDKTAFIRQEDIEINGGEEFETKLRNLVSGGQEDISYETASKKIDTAIKKISKDKTGLISEIEKKEDLLNAQLLKSEENYKSWLEITDLLNNALEQEKTLKNKILELTKEQNEVKSALAYERLKKVLKCKKIIDEYENNINTLISMKSYNGFIADEHYIANLKRLLQDFRLYKDKYSMCSDDVKVALKRLEDKKKSIKDYDSIANDTQAILEKVNRASATRKRYLLFGGVISLGAMGVALFAYFSGPNNISMLVAAIIFAIFGIVLLITHFTSGDKAKADRLAYQFGFSNATRLFEAIEEYKEITQQLHNAKSFYEETLQREKSQKEEYSKIFNEINNLCALRGLNEITVSSVEMLIAELEGIDSRISMIKAQKDTSKAMLNGLLEGTNFEELKKIASNEAKNPDVSIEEIEKELSILRKSLTEQTVKIANLNNTANNIFNNSNTPDTICTALIELKNNKDILKENNLALSIALKTLYLAFEELQLLFAPELNKKAQEIFALLTNRKDRKIFIDKKNNVNILENGITRELIYFSTGTKDAAYLSVRLAVAKLIYKENPVLIFDDSFSHFDLDRLNSAMKTVLGLNDFQILLFTCREDEGKIIKDSAYLIKI